MVAPVENETVWLNLREIVVDTGERIERVIRQFALNVEKGCLTLFFDDDEATTLWMQPAPALLKKWPEMKADGERFTAALARLTGATIGTAEELEAVLNDEGILTVGVELTTTTFEDGETKTYPRWDISRVV